VAYPTSDASGSQIHQSAKSPSAADGHQAGAALEAGLRDLECRVHVWPSSAFRDKRAVPTLIDNRVDRCRAPRASGVTPRTQGGAHQVLHPCSCESPLCIAGLLQVGIELRCRVCLVPVEEVAVALRHVRRAVTVPTRSTPSKTRLG